jgi:hypothetical protein
LERIKLLPLRLSTFDILAVTNTLGKEKRPLEIIPTTLIRKWLPTLDTLRNLFYAPTVDIKIEFELLRQGSLTG